MPDLLGPDGQKIPRPTEASLKRRFVDSGASRTLWRSATGRLTPAKLSTMLRSHADGELTEFMSFAEDVEEKNEHYGSVLGTRKRAVEGVDISVQPGGDSDQDKEIAKFVGTIIDAPNFPDLVEDMLDALGKGFSVSEIIWHTTAQRWTPVEYVHINPAKFQLGKDSRELRLQSSNNRDGIALAPFKFITHWSKLKSGQPHRAALARFIGWTYLFQSFTLKDWVGYVETYGQPVRVGRYGQEATEEDIKALIGALQNIGSDAAAAIPDSMKMEFIKTASGSSGQTFEKLSEFLDRRISKAVLGQTMTTDDGSSQAQATVHDDVRTDIKRSDARKICKSINLHLIRPAIDLNFGPQVRYPMVIMPVLDPQDLKELREAVKDFTQMGVRIPTRFVQERWGIPSAADGDDVLQPPAQGEAQTGPSTARRLNLARASSSPAAEGLVDEIQAQGLDGWERIMSPLINPIRSAVADADNYEEAAELLAAAHNDMDPSELANAIRTAMLTTRAVGDATD